MPGVAIIVLEGGSQPVSEMLGIASVSPSHPPFPVARPPGGSLTSRRHFATLRPWKRTLLALVSGQMPRRPKSNFLSEATRDTVG